MNGLEINEISFFEAFGNRDFRIDSEFYEKPPFKYNHFNYVPIGSILENSQYGLSRDMNEEGIGYKMYRMNEIHDMFTDIDVAKHADITQTELQQFKLNDRDVLFNRTNSFALVGRTGLYRKINDENFVFASYLIRLNPDESVVLPEFLTVFLNTNLGIWDIKRRARQSINQANVNAEEVKDIKIPLMSLNFQNLIKNLFDNAHETRILSEKLYREAELLLLSELDLTNFFPSDESIAIKSFSESFGTSGRLDSEYYQPKYDEIIAKIKSYKGGVCTLKDLGKFSNGSFIPEEFYTECGQRAYIRIKELSFNSPINEDVVIYIMDEFQSTNETTVQKNNYVIATIGNTIGKVNLVTQNFSGSFISNNTSKYALFNQNAHFHYFELLLRSFLVQEQIQREFTQTAQPKISNSSLENIVIPIITESVQKEIEKKISESFMLRTESKRFLEEAKTAVERAIEQGEPNG